MLSLTTCQRRGLVEQKQEQKGGDDGERLSRRRQVELLSLNRSTLYYQPKAISPQNQFLREQVRQLHAERPYYGWRRITAVLRRQGHRLNGKRTRRLMQQQGLRGYRPKPNLSKRRQVEAISPYLLRGVKAKAPNHIWGIDITYIPLDEPGRGRRYVYLVAVIDWHSRYVISWELEQSLRLAFVLEAVKRAMVVAKPGIFNSDQGSHFTSGEYQQLLHEAAVQISMDGKGRALDNVYTERLWWSVKHEEVYWHEYTSMSEVRRAISRYLQFYNHERPHQALGYLTPAEVYWGQPVTGNQKGEVVA